MRAQGWTPVPWADLAPHVARDEAWWAEHLHWDTREAWVEVDRARRASRIPGVVATADDGSVRGLAYGLVEGDVALVAPLVADSLDACRSALTALLTVARAQGAREVSYFGPATPNVEATLAEAGFSVQAYLYLERTISDLRSPINRLQSLVDDRVDPWASGAPSQHDSLVRAWRAHDEPLAAELLRRAYGDAGRPFAPHGRPEEWARYVHNLVAFTGCGRFEPALSRVIEGGVIQGAIIEDAVIEDAVIEEGAGLVAASLVTTVGPRVAHLAQLAVDPDRRGRGHAGALVDAALLQAARAGCSLMTLLVAAHAGAARRVYESRGFAPRATFLAGWLRPEGPMMSTAA